MNKYLSKLELDIVLLRLIDNYKFDEIAYKLKENINTIKTKYYRALKKLSKRKVKYEMKKSKEIF